jgi:anthranilate phosphoribosyltransferase
MTSSTGTSISTPPISEHPFAPFVRALGKGPQLARHLTEAEAFEAGCMVMDGRVEPIQLGAFLCLMRVMGETPEELAGLVRAARQSLRPSMPARNIACPGFCCPPFYSAAPESVS